MYVIYLYFVFLAGFCSILLYIFSRETCYYPIILLQNTQTLPILKLFFIVYWFTNLNVYFSMQNTKAHGALKERCFFFKFYTCFIC